jgi:hypothetical protein
MDYKKKRLHNLITNLKEAQANGYHFIYCENHQNVPEAIVEGQFAKSGTEADQLACYGRTQLITDWVKDLEAELANEIEKNGN